MTLSHSAKDQEQLVDFVREALARIDAGKPVDPEQLCATQPHLAQPLAEALGLASDLPNLQAEALREDPLAGLLLADRYRLVDCLGRGAMGVVYRAEDQDLQRQVAVKILDARLFRDPKAEERFQREAEALAALQSDAVVTVHDRGRTAEGIHFLVMELLEGATLSQILDQIAEGEEPLSVVEQVLGRKSEETYWPRLCAVWARSVARGLKAAHEHGVVHRDVKPSNVFLRQSGVAALLDFGIAVQSSEERLTATEATVGTPWYMPPEQVSSEEQANSAEAGAAHATLDVYGLGATLYHLLAGRTPYEGDAVKVITSLLTKDPAPLQRVQPGTPRDLVAIVEHCLERKPSRRYQTADALLDDLDAFLAHQPVSVRPIGPVARRLRAWRRAPAQPIAITAILIAALVFSIWLPTYREQQRQQIAEQKNELHATIPTLLAVDGWPDQRGLAALRAEHQQAISLLDRILELDSHDLPVRLFRAALRFDLGDRQGAASDLEFVAADQGGEYLQQLAQRYLAADDLSLGNVDTDGLPAPETAQECYVAGFHELRARDRPGFANRASVWFDRAVPDYLPARDLRLLAVAGMADGSQGDYRKQLTDFLYAEAITLEEIYGRQTARTQAMRGLALLFGKSYADAIPFFERALELRPDRQGPHTNLGIAYLRLGDIERSRQHLDKALKLRPFAWTTKYTLAQLEQQTGDFRAANEWAEQLPTEDGGIRPWLRANLLGTIAAAEAISLFKSDPQTSRQLAGRAQLLFDEGLRQAPGHKALVRNREFVVALQSDDPNDALIAYVEHLMTQTQEGPGPLRNLSFLMPLELGPRETAWMQAFLRHLAAQQAGSHAALRAQLKADIEELLRPFR
ncbi:MAG: protein kinase [Planctomycetota bacterium]|nr:protein kinase [Planctomycetota bacterium]